MANTHVQYMLIYSTCTVIDISSLYNIHAHNLSCRRQSHSQRAVQTTVTRRTPRADDSYTAHTPCRRQLHSVHSVQTTVTQTADRVLADTRVFTCSSVSRATGDGTVPKKARGEQLAFVNKSELRLSRDARHLCSASKVQPGHSCTRSRCRTVTWTQTQLTALFTSMRSCCQ